MRKILLANSISVALLASVLAFTSCLGSSGTKMESNNTPTYIGYDETSGVGKYAIANNSYHGFTSAYIQGESVRRGKFYDIDYKYSTDDGGRQGKYTTIYTASHVAKNGDGEPYPETYVHINEQTETAEEVELTDVNIIHFHPYKLLDDMWAFQYTCRTYDEDFNINNGVSNLKFIATVDSENQNEESAEGQIPVPLKDDQLIVNLRLERKSPSQVGESSKLKAHAGKASIDFSAVRAYFYDRLQGEIGEDEVKSTAIQFVYTKVDSEGNNGKPEKIGDIRVEYATYGMYIAEPGYMEK